MLSKLILNLILVPIPEIGIKGAACGTVICHVIAFAIAIVALAKNIKLNLRFSKFVIKPLLATAIMGICSYYIYLTLSGIIAVKMATLVAIVLAVIIYIMAIISLKVFTKDEILMIPAGEKVCKVLEKLKIY